VSGRHKGVGTVRFAFANRNVALGDAAWLKRLSIAGVHYYPQKGHFLVRLSRSPRGLRVVCEGKRRREDVYSKKSVSDVLLHRRSSRVQSHFRRQRTLRDSGEPSLRSKHFLFAISRDCTVNRALIGIP